MNIDEHCVCKQATLSTVLSVSEKKQTITTISFMSQLQVKAEQLNTQMHHYKITVIKMPYTVRSMSWKTIIPPFTVGKNPTAALHFHAKKTVTTLNVNYSDL